MQASQPSHVPLGESNPRNLFYMAESDLHRLGGMASIARLREQVRAAIPRVVAAKGRASLRAFISLDLIPLKTRPDRWAIGESERISRMLERQLSAHGARARSALEVDVIVLDTLEDFTRVQVLTHEGESTREQAEEAVGDVATNTMPSVQAIAADPVDAPPVLRVLDDPTRAPIEVRGDVILGRRQAPGVTGLGDSLISRRHLRIRRDGNVLHVTDLESKNGTRVNGEVIAPHESRPLAVGDVVALGGTQIRIEAAPEA